MKCKCKGKCVCRNNYELAVLEGRAFGMTLSEYLDSLKGQDGNQGPMGLRGLPGINGSNGTDGIATFTSYVFKRADTIPDTPIGGSYLFPFPTDTTWVDNPIGGSGVLYISSRVFTSNGNPPQTIEWSTPVIAADSESIDFQWSSLDFNPGTPETIPANWTNEADETTVWMGIRRKSDGVWGNWNIVRIKGENGNQGEPGNTIEIRYQKNGSFSTPPELDNLSRVPAGWSTVSPTIITGEYVWQIQAIINQVTNVLVGTWTNPVRVTGERGENGTQGPSAIFRGDWKSTEQYTGNNIGVDIVKYIINGKGYIARVDAGTIPIGTLPTNSTYWNEVPVNIDALFTDFLFAYSAYIQDLTVGSLQTALTGTRMIIDETENVLHFYQGSNPTPSVSIGLMEIPSLGIPSSIPTIVGGVFAGETKFHENGFYSYGPSGTRFYKQTTSSGPVTTYRDYVANMVAIQSNPSPTNATISKFGFSTNSLYIRHLMMGAFETEGIFVHDMVTNEPVQGYTGTIGGAKFIDGICVGPA